MAKSTRFNPHTREREKIHRSPSFSKARPRQWSGIAPSGNEAIFVYQSRYDPENQLNKKRQSYEQMIVQGRFNKKVETVPEPVITDVRSADRRTFADALEDIRNKPQIKTQSRFASKIKPFEKK